MKNYTITVNGNVYDVTVEEGSASSQVTTAPKTVAKAAPKAATKVAGTKGAIEISAPMPGKILKVNVNLNDQVKKGDVLMILEAMKMENEIQAPEDGTVASIEVAAGDSVESGKLLASLN